MIDMQSEQEVNSSLEQGNSIPHNGKKDKKPLVSNVPVGLRREFYKHAWPVPIYGCMTYSSPVNEDQACCPLFAEACFCPGITLGRNASILQREPFLNRFGLGPKGQRLCQQVCLAQLFTCWLGCGWPVCGSCILIQRAEIKAKYNIAGKETCWHGCLKPFCCYSCALFQENVFLREQDIKRKAEAAEGVSMDQALLSPLDTRPPTIQELHSDDLELVNAPSEHTQNLETTTNLSGASGKTSLPKVPSLKGKEEIMKMHFDLNAEEEVNWGANKRHAHERMSSIDLTEESADIPTPRRSFRISLDSNSRGGSSNQLPVETFEIVTQSIKAEEEATSSMLSTPNSRSNSKQQISKFNHTEESRGADAAIIIQSAISLPEEEDLTYGEEVESIINNDQKFNNTI